jgi:alkylation response protein AidB-like acyl-CoA dehydrogenase
MDYRDTPEEAEYRARLRAWLAEVVPSVTGGGTQRASIYRAADSRLWHRALYEAGYIGQSWPAEQGGGGLGPVYDYILNDECGAAGAPSLPSNVNYLGRSIASFGTPEQRERFLVPTMSGEIRWCQGFSEPSGGSDLAALRTVAELRGDHYVANGQKLWTSGAHLADWCFLLARTDPKAPKHKGISALLVKMDTPGIEPRAVETSDGGAHTSECFFDDVVIPADQVLGDPGDGWRIAMSALAYERGPADNGVLSVARREVDEIQAAAVERGRTDDPDVRRGIADAHVASEVLRLSALRQLTLRALDLPPGAENQVNKILWSRCLQRIGHVGLELADTDAFLHEADDSVGRYFESRHSSVYGGTVQIQRNLLARRGMHLPTD